jgi:hypothetical protein
MSLRFEKLEVRSVGFGAANHFAQNALTVNPRALVPICAVRAVAAEYGE